MATDETELYLDSLKLSRGLRPGEEVVFGYVISKQTVPPRTREHARRLAAAQCHHAATAELKRRHQDEYKEIHRVERLRRGLPPEIDSLASLAVARARI